MDLVIQRNSNQADFYFLLKVLLQQLNQLEEALQQINLAINIDSNVDYIYTIKEIYQKIYRFEEALNNYYMSILINPQDQGAYFQKGTMECVIILIKGNVLYNCGKFLEALESYDNAVNYNFHKVMQKFVRTGLTLEQLDRLNEALQCYDFAIQNNPVDYMAFLKKANILRCLNRFQEALNYYDFANQRKQEDSNIILNKGYKSFLNVSKNIFIILRIRDVERKQQKYMSIF